ncbi:sorting nexin 2B-like [Selaginella moellendorffii]|uniref:sorting nexin 2B-like n=1 Tax=Selaginella moellendorffii TaxID=88036 RepID=UPI000D1CC5C3|nr:sorting nexin 2B-like [Selaginella moellendorffii]|eukprot:XP_024516111.1 sorting nexin 2B-like [Selaginella moellendorffii]
MMDGSGGHPLDPDRRYSVESLTMDPLLADRDEEESSRSNSNSTYSLVASPVDPLAHPLGREDSQEEELEFSKETNDDDDDDDDDRLEDASSATITSTAGGDRLIHQLQSSSEGEFLNIIVTQPQKEADSASSLIPGGSYFVTYLVSARTNMPEYGKSEHNVRRRFKDIVALADSLVEKYRGYFIPARPDKSIVESQIMDKHNFIEQRRLGIERYLRRLASHSVLRKSEELRTFIVSKAKLQMVPTLDVASRMLDGAAKLPRQLFGDGPAAVNPQEVVHSAKGGRDLLRLFKELRQSVTNDWGASRPPVVEEDKEFVEKKEHLRECERRLAHASQQADAFTKAQKNLASVLGDVGLSFMKLAKLETQQAPNKPHGADVRRLATAVVRSSRGQRASNAQAERHLDYLHEHLAVLQSAQYAFADRDNALLTVQTLLSDISMMHARAEKHSAAASKVFGGDKGRNKKIDDLKDSIRMTEEACECAQQKYNQIKDHNRTEIERLEATKQSEFFNMIHGFVQSQVGYAERIAKEWTRVAEESAEYSGRRVDSPIFKSNLSFHGR